MYRLHIGNKTYSSWSLRPWLLMRALGIDFEEALSPFVDGGSYDSFRSFSPTGLVPCLCDGDTTVWESLSIVEYLAEQHAGVWPQDQVARSWARCAAAEMHAGFRALRDECPMICGVTLRLHRQSPALERDLARLRELWSQGLERFGGPFLAGAEFTAVDAFFAPVALRIQTYQLDIQGSAGVYAQQLLALPAMRQWQDAALLEPWREPLHEAEIRQSGQWLEDRRRAVDPE